MTRTSAAWLGCRANGIRATVVACLDQRKVIDSVPITVLPVPCSATAM